MWRYLFCICILVVSGSSAFYSSEDGIIDLSSNGDAMLNGKELWIVEFYAPWCKACQAFAEDYKKIANILKGVIKVGAVNVDTKSELGAKFPTNSVPTIKIFGHDKTKPVEYSGDKSVSHIISVAMRELQAMIDMRQGKSRKAESSGPAVIELTASNFDEKVLKSTEMWLVEFYAPWCGHCKNLKPHWDQAAATLKGKINLGAVDATIHQQLAAKYGVNGYPTIKFFEDGKSDPKDYTGGRTADEIVAWALDKVQSNLPPPEILEATSQGVVEKNCGDKQLCIISALPVLLDCQSKCRNDYIKILKESAEKFKKNNWGWLWAEATTQPEVEKALDIGGFGYPAMVAVNTRKMKFASLRGPFSIVGINEFLRDLSMGRGSVPLREIKELPPVKTRAAWDGKDAKVIEEEEIDLKDLGIKTEL